LEFQYKFDWCINDNTKRRLIFDFVFLDLKIIIELDGRQHFIQVLNWQLNNDTQERDIYKMKCANQNDYTIIRIVQTDVLYNRNNWQQKLKDVIKEYKKPEYIFISRNNEYKPYIEQLNID